MAKELPNHEILLLQGASKGDEDAFAQLFIAYKDRLFGFILRITNSKEIAEDVVQEIFLKIWMQKEKLSEIRNFNAFLFRAAQNHAINLLRRRAKEILILKEKQSEKTPPLAPNEELHYKNTRQFINKKVEELPPQQKTIYRLSREQNMKQKEIAERLGLSLSTVQNHLSRALHTLREKLEERMRE